MQLLAGSNVGNGDEFQTHNFEHMPVVLKLYTNTYIPVFFEIPTDRTTKFRHVSRRLRKDARRRLTEIRRSAVIKQSASRRRPFESRTMLFDQVKNRHRRATTGRTSSRESCQVSAGRSIERSQTPTKTPDRRRRRRFYSGRGVSNNRASELRASACKMRPKN